MKKVIAVLGATGAQGGGLVRAILNDPSGEFAARAITRDKNSEKALQLAAAGAEVVVAEADDRESLERAFDGAYGAFCVTFFWDHMSPEKELAQATNMAEASRTAGLQHVIWSTLENTRKWIPLDDDRMPTLMGKYKVPHFDAKGEADDVFKGLGLPVTLLGTSFYWDNFIHFGMEPQRGPDGRLAITLPMGEAPMSGIASEDIGKCALGVFKAGDKYIGKWLGIAGEHLTGDQMASSLSRALDRDIGYNSVEPAIFRTFDFPGADDLGNMFQFFRDFADYFCGARSIEESRSLNPDLMTFDEWLKEKGDLIPRVD